jgi:hypothetical protein
MDLYGNRASQFVNNTQQIPISNEANLRKRNAPTIKENANKKKVGSANPNTSSEHIKKGLDDFKNADYKSDIFISMIECGSIILHPKTHFIKHFKEILKPEKKKLGDQLMRDLTSYVIKNYYNDARYGDLTINTKSKIDSLIEDIYNLSVSIQERKKLKEPHNIFKMNMFDVIDQMTNSATNQASAQALQNNNSMLLGDEEQDDWSSYQEDEQSFNIGENSQVDLSQNANNTQFQLNLQSMNKILDSNNEIRNELKELKMNRDNINVRLDELQLEMEQQKVNNDNMRNEFKLEIKKDVRELYETIIGNEDSEMKLMKEKLDKLVHDIDAIREENKSKDVAISNLIEMKPCESHDKLKPTFSETLNKGDG